MTIPAAALLICVLLTPVLAGDVSRPLDVQDVVKQMEERGRTRSASVLHYTCLRRYTLMNRRFHQLAELRARMTCSASGHKTFEILSEQGISVIRRKVLRRMLEAEEEASRDENREHTQITPLNYSFRLLGTQMQAGRRAYVLEVVPKRLSEFLIRGHIWVDCDDFGIMRVEAVPAVKPSAFLHNIHVDQQYAKVGTLWLLRYNRSASESFFFGHTDVTIDAYDYRVTQKPMGPAAAAHGGF